MKTTQLTKVFLLLAFTGIYIFLFFMAFDIVFDPGEPRRVGLEIFCFVSPVILPVSISLFIYHWFMSKEGNLYLRYLKALLIAATMLSVSILLAAGISKIIWEYLERKHIETGMYHDFFEWGCYNDYEMKTLPLALFMSVGTVVGGLTLYGFMILIKRCYTFFRMKK